MPRPLFQQIWHGDSIEMCKKFKPESVDCIITDPPFGVDNLSNQAVTPEGKEYARKIANDEDPVIAMQTFRSVMDVLIPKTKPDSDLYVFTSQQVLDEWMQMTKEYLGTFGYRRSAIIVWEKEGPGMGDTECPWGQGSEFILFFQKGRRLKTGTRRNSVVRVPQVRPGDLIHPHEKPVALLELFLKQSTIPLDFIVDPFGGSGSLVRACERTGRSGVCIELDKNNYDLSLKKFEEGEGAGFALG